MAMLKALKQIFSPDPHVLQAQLLYNTCVSQARQTFFYKEWNIPDTLDGRFDVLVLHVFLLLRALKGEPAMAEAVTDAFFKDMDRNLREMGVGDPGVGKRIRKMLDALYGRIAAYETAWNEDAALKDALNRNLYAEKGDVSSLDTAVTYVRSCAKQLETQAVSLREGRCSWPSGR